MTFEEWWLEYRGFPDPYDGLVRLAWEAGQAAEREECAKVCEELSENAGRIASCLEGDSWIDCAKAIRERV